MQILNKKDSGLKILMRDSSRIEACFSLSTLPDFLSQVLNFTITFIGPLDGRLLLQSSLRSDMKTQYQRPGVCDCDDWIRYKNAKYSI